MIGQLETRKFTKSFFNGRLLGSDVGNDSKKYFHILHACCFMVDGFGGLAPCAGTARSSLCGTSKASSIKAEYSERWFTFLTTDTYLKANLLELNVH